MIPVVLKRVMEEIIFVKDSTPLSSQYLRELVRWDTTAAGQLAISTLRTKESRVAPVGKLT